MTPVCEKDPPDAAIAAHFNCLWRSPASNPASSGPPRAAAGDEPAESQA